MVSKECSSCDAALAQQFEFSHREGCVKIPIGFHWLTKRKPSRIASVKCYSALADERLTECCLSYVRKWSWSTQFGMWLKKTSIPLMTRSHSVPRAIKSPEPFVLLPRKLPTSLKPCFWDVRFEQLDGRRDGDFVAARLLESGGWQSILWLCRAAGDDALQRLVRQRGGRGLSRGQLRFWQIRWELPKRLVDSWLKRDAHRFDKSPQRAAS